MGINFFPCLQKPWKKNSYTGQKKERDGEKQKSRQIFWGNQLKLGPNNASKSNLSSLWVCKDRITSFKYRAERNYACNRTH